MFDGKIVAACIASRQAYERVKSHVDPQEFTPTGKFWWGLVAEWYAADPAANSVDALLLRSRAERTAGRNAGMALDWYDSVQHEACPSADNVALEVLALKKEVTWRKLAAAMEGERDNEEIRGLTKEYYDLTLASSLQKRSAVTWGSDLDSLSTAIGAGHRVRLWPERLQTATGGALPGHHIVLFGRPEVGKTLFTTNMTAGWLRDDQEVLYVGNEDSIDIIQDRIRWNLSGMTKEQVEKFTDEANRRCRNKNWAKLSAVHMFPGSAAEIEDIIGERKPKCLVVDQLRNFRSGIVKGGGGTKAQRLDDVACDIRQLGAKYGLVVLSVGQANAGEHGRRKVWLDLDDFDESRTGVPGQADLMVGIGMDETLAANNQRALSLPKNKLSGNHEGFIVTVDTTRSKIQ